MIKAVVTWFKNTGDSDRVHERIECEIYGNSVREIEQKIQKKVQRNIEDDEMHIARQPDKIIMETV